MLFALALATAASGAPAAAPAAPAAPATPPALAAYERAVADTTATVRAALPRLAMCQPPGPAKLVLKVDLANGAAVTTAALAATGATKISAPCFEKVVQDVFLKNPPAAGLEAAVVLDLTAGPALEGDVALLGALDKESIEAGMRGALDRVAQCYIVGLGEAPSLAGHLIVAFTVLPDGRTYRPEVKRTGLWSPTVEECVLRQVASTSFRPPDGAAIVRVTYPFAFNGP